MMRTFGFLSTLALLGMVSCTSVSPTSLPTDSRIPSNQTVILNVTIVDVEKGITIPGQAVILAGDRIEKIRPVKDLVVPKSARVIAGQGLYLLPGLVDAHVHFLDAPIFGRLMIANGILLVRDMGMPNEYILDLRDKLNRGEVLGPEMVASGVILDGYPPIIPSTSLGLRTSAEGREAVRAQVAAGADMIKVYSRLEKDVCLAIVEEAQKKGIAVVGHVPDSISIQDAAAAGLKSSEHFFGFEKVLGELLDEPVYRTYRGMGAEAGYFNHLSEVDPAKLQAVFQQLKANGLTVCPTVVVFKTATATSAIMQGKFTGSEYISSTVTGLWKSLWGSQADLEDFIWKNWAQMVRQLNQAGVPLMVGTDLLTPGILPGFSVHEEMTIWQEAGIPPADILRSATITPSKFMGLDGRLGSIEEGKTASMLLLRANPLEDVRNARQIEGVFLRGEYYDRSELDGLLAEARDLARVVNP